MTSVFQNPDHGETCCSKGFKLLRLTNVGHVHMGVSSAICRYFIKQEVNENRWFFISPPIPDHLKEAAFFFFRKMQTALNVRLYIAQGCSKLQDSPSDFF